jgi:uncharacterized protein YfaS (alpha-2-macroglobulin family)
VEDATTRLSRGAQLADSTLAKEQSADRAAPAGPAIVGQPAVAAAASAGGAPGAGALAAKPDTSAAPSSLYFNPQLVTDNQGRATVRFVMPQVESEYRVLIDALGQGRIGSHQQIINSGNP